MSSDGEKMKLLGPRDCEPERASSNKVNQEPFETEAREQAQRREEDDEPTREPGSAQKGATCTRKESQRGAPTEIYTGSGHWGSRERPTGI